MLIRWLGVVVLVLAPLAVHAADEENPFKKVKAGDYAKHTAAFKVGDKSQEFTRTTTVKEVSDKEVIFKQETTVAGKDVKGKDIKIDLTKPFDPSSVFSGVPGGGFGNTKWEKLKDGKEKVKIDGKEYDCTWTTYKPDLGAKVGGKVEGELKVWLCKDIPDVVKTTLSIKAAGFEINIEMALTEFGNKK